MAGSFAMQDLARVLDFFARDGRVLCDYFSKTERGFSEK